MPNFVASRPITTAPACRQEGVDRQLVFAVLRVVGLRIVLRLFLLGRFFLGLLFSCLFLSLCLLRCLFLGRLLGRRFLLRRLLYRLDLGFAVFLFVIVLFLLRVFARSELKTQFAFLSIDRQVSREFASFFGQKAGHQVRFTVNEKLDRLLGWDLFLQDSFTDSHATLVNFVRHHGR